MLAGAFDTVAIAAEDAASTVTATAIEGVVAPVAQGPAAASPSMAGEPAPVPEKADTAWMLVSTLLVLLMALPGLALFYGGMVRARNALSVMMQVFVIFSLMTILWAVYGYSLAFTGTGTWVGGTERLFLAGITVDSTAATFSEGVVIPEYLFVAFQGTFAALAPCLVVGAFAERMRFSAVLLFSVLWFTLSYLPIARMVWHPDGYLFKLGAIDFAGGTVVHINAGIAGLVGAIVVGRRLGFGQTMMPPHNLPLVMVGAALLWVGWFGFNVGSNLEANNLAGLVFVNTMLATAAAVCAWTFAEWALRGTPTMLGAASGAIAGLVAITPACGAAGPMGAILLGLLAGVVCLWAVSSLKTALGYDDSLDVFGVHCVGGILGALATAVLNAPGLGGQGGDDFRIDSQLAIQATGVVITVIWSVVVSLIGYKLADAMVGLRVGEDYEREGLDTAEHGERAYVN
ncbi:MAG TPA: ammonia channel protein [Gammaproteobacteria bacterium]|nr:ammonia channel protein [Gammaproteobacteria bacterium]